MESFEPEKRRRGYLFFFGREIDTHRWSYIVGGILLAIAFFWGGAGLMHSWEIHKQIRAVEADIDSLNAVIEYRRNRQEELGPGGDELALEREARLKHNMIRPGERMYVVEPEKK